MLKNIKGCFNILNSQTNFNMIASRNIKENLYRLVIKYSNVLKIKLAFIKYA